MRRLILAALVLAACTGGAADPARPTVGTNQPTTTTIPIPMGEIVFRLSDVEALAATGAPVRVGDTVELSGVDPGRLLLPIGRPVTLTVSYLGDEAANGPFWTQQVQADENGPVEVIIEQPWRSAGEVGEPIVLGWQATSDSATYLEQLKTAPGLTVSSPRWWTLDADGYLVGEADPDFVTAAHDMGVQVWPYVTNGFEVERTRRALAAPQQRKLIAAQLSGQAQLAGADGINVDFEAFSPIDRDNFTAFVAELSEFVHAWGGVVSVDITARTRNYATLSEARANLFDRRALGEAADYVALMAYDEYNRFRPFGPTASQEWAEDALHWLLRYLDPHQILLGVPFYSRIWDPEEPGRPTTATIGTVVELAGSNPRAIDPGFGIDRIDLADGRFLWAEDYDNLARRIALARATGVAGIAAWRLGFDTPEVWEVVEREIGG